MLYFDFFIALLLLFILKKSFIASFSVVIFYLTVCSGSVFLIMVFNPEIDEMLRPPSWLFSRHVVLLSGIFLLIVLFRLWRIERGSITFIFWKKEVVIIFILFLLWLFSIMGGVIFQWGEGTLSALALKGVVLSVFMIVYSFIFGIASLCEIKLKYDNTKIAIVVLIIILLAVFSGLYEILFQRSFVVNTSVTGRVEIRACSWFLNPNFFGLWCLFSIFLAIYLSAIKTGGELYYWVAVMTASFGIFLSGSRSVLVLYCSLVLLLYFLLWAKPIAEKNKMMPLIGALSVMICLVLVGKFIGYYYVELDTKHSIQLFVSLAERFFNIKHSIFSFIGVESNMGQIGLASIEGRFMYTDNGYLFYSYFFGPIACISWVAFILYILWIAVKEWFLAPNIDVVFAILLITGFGLSGFLMQSYQAFPVFGWLSFGLILYWRWFFLKIKNENTYLCSSGLL